MNTNETKLVEGAPRERCLMDYYGIKKTEGNETPKESPLKNQNVKESPLKNQNVKESPLKNQNIKESKGKLLPGQPRETNLMDYYGIKKQKETEESPKEEYPKEKPIQNQVKEEENL